MTGENRNGNGDYDFEPIRNERDLYRFRRLLVEDYFRYGSVDEVLKEKGYPISWATYQRVLDRWGVIKHVDGRPRSRLSEILAFFQALIEEKVPLEMLHHQMENKLSVSKSTLHRIRRNIENSVVRSAGAILIVTPRGRPEMVLVGKDVSASRPEVGKLSGSLSLPMGYAKFGEPRRKSIGRILQNEVFTHFVIERGAVALEEIEYKKAFKSVIVTDIRVSAYHVELTETMPPFSSFKLKDHRFVSVGELLSLDPVKSNVRPGVIEATRAYKQIILDQDWDFARFDSISQLNLDLVGLRT